MFCEKCGTQLPDDAMFCPECGEKVKVFATPQPQPQGQKVKAPIPKKTLGLVAAAIAVLAVVVGVVIFIATRPKKISLNQYVTADFEGYDGYGTVKIEFDEDRFLEENRKKTKLKLKGKEKKIYEAFNDTAADALVYLVQDYELSEKNQLSNGSTVTYKWNIKDDEILKVYGVKLKYSDIEFKVEGLKKLKEFDPFEAIDVKFEGITSFGYANIQYKDMDDNFPYLYYDLDKSDNLCLGDEVTVTISSYGSEDIVEYCAKNYGMKPKSLSKTYKVEGLQEIQEFDPFDAISVQFEGIAPYTYANINYNDVADDFPSLCYELDRQDNLNIGDEVTVTVTTYGSEDVDAYCAEYYGKHPTTLQKTFKVENVPQYIMSDAMLPKKDLDSLIEDYKAKFTEAAEDTWDDFTKFNSIEYVGYYLLTGKEENYSRNNQLSLVFQVNMTIDLPDYNYNEDYTYYYTVSYNNIKLNESGVPDIDYNDFANTTDYVQKDVAYGEEYWENVSFYYYGYDTLDTAKYAVKSGFGYDYDCYTNLE